MKKNRGETLAHWLERFPAAHLLPFQVNRRNLYRVSELYKGYDPKHPGTWTSTFDRFVYEWTLNSTTDEVRQLKPYEAVAERLHDTATGQAIGRFLDKEYEQSFKPVVGFMGGHDTDRDKPEFRAVATIARALRKLKFTIVSGGGPGLMEAANFGAFMAPYTESQFRAALDTLGASPSASDNAQWIASACHVRKQLLPRWNAPELPRSVSLGIPTWYYGHEPPNLFATHTGKYFFNSIREDGLVSIANGGIVFGPGKAGTVQEIFQDTTLNFYRKRPTPPPSLMVLLGVDFWNPNPANDVDAGSIPDPDRKPVYPLLFTLAGQARQKFNNALLLTDNTAEVIEFIANFHATSLGVADSAAAPRSARFKGRALAAL
jgi:predicted Rossmann-fold nucleotide-binding protein